jgi:hypothetical protein
LHTLIVRVALSREIGVPFGLASGAARPVDVVCTVAKNRNWVPGLNTMPGLPEALRPARKKRDVMTGCI